MAQRKIETTYFSKDIRDFLALLFKHDVHYIIVGGEAVIYYGHARLTGDLAIYYENSDDNIEKLFNALKMFWESNIPGINNKEELAQTNLIVQFGVPPNRIDLINSIDGINFQSAWKTREKVQITINKQRMQIFYISLELLIKNKEKLKRPRDLEDLNYLYKVHRS